VEPEIPTALQDLLNLILIKREPKRFNLESIRAGSKIFTLGKFSLRLDDSFTFGTLGFIGMLESLGPSTCHYHIVDDRTPIYVQDDADEKIFSLQFVPELVRTLGIPQFRVGKPSISPVGQISLNEICLLETAHIAHDVLQCLLPSIDCNRFNADEKIDEDPALAARDPKLGNMRKLRSLVNEGDPIGVHKYGAATGYTTGSLFKIEKYKSDVAIYKLKIIWKSPNEPFATGGDSRSLVWAKDGEVIVPLGIHCGSEGTISYSLSLWSFCKEI
jgi:Peptidase family S64